MPESHVNPEDPNKTKGSIREKFRASGGLMLVGQNGLVISDGPTISACWEGSPKS